MPPRLRIRPGLRNRKTKSNLLLPVAPTSPLFDGMNQDINTEAFPAFEDLPGFFDDEASEPVHCSVHCKMNTCWRMRKKGIKVSECQCAWEEEEIDEQLEEQLQLDEQPEEEIEAQLDEAPGSILEVLFDWALLMFLCWVTPGVAPWP